LLSETLPLWTLASAEKTMQLQSFTFRDKQQQKRTVDIIFENEHLLVVNKPPHLPVIPDRWNVALPNLKDLLQHQYQKITGSAEQAAWVVHRIDADTSGIVMFAKSAPWHRALNELFENQQINKTYLAITSGFPPEESGVIELPLRSHPGRRQLMQVHKNGKPSKTAYKILEKFKRYCLLEISPQTGRTHQIRVHLAALHCPLAIDPLYGSPNPITLWDIKERYKSNPILENPALINRLTLHACRIQFKDPFQNQEYSFEAPLPKDFSALLKALRKW
jgi:RluA family pseudouridine synthase